MSILISISWEPLLAAHWDGVHVFSSKGQSYKPREGCGPHAKDWCSSQNHRTDRRAKGVPLLMTVTIATPVKMHRLTILSEKRISFKLLSRIGDLIFFFFKQGLHL